MEIQPLLQHQVHQEDLEVPEELMLEVQEIVHQLVHHKEIMLVMVVQLEQLLEVEDQEELEEMGVPVMIDQTKYQSYLMEEMVVMVVMSTSWHQEESIIFIT